jgi:hypothetical protein
MYNNSNGNGNGKSSMKESSMKDIKNMKDMTEERSASDMFITAFAN